MTAPTPERPLDVGVLLATYRIISRQVGLSEEARRDVEEIVAALERIPELEREVKDLALARVAAKHWQERVERVESAAGPFIVCEVAGPQESRPRCGSCAGCRLRAALAAAPAPDRTSVDVRQVVEDWWSKWSIQAGPPEDLKADLVRRVERVLADASAPSRPFVRATPEAQPDHATNTYGLIQRAAAPAEEGDGGR